MERKKEFKFETLDLEKMSNLKGGVSQSTTFTFSTRLRRKCIEEEEGVLVEVDTETETELEFG